MHHRPKLRVIPKAKNSLGRVARTSVVQHRAAGGLLRDPPQVIIILNGEQFPLEQAALSESSLATQDFPSQQQPIPLMAEIVAQK